MRKDAFLFAIEKPAFGELLISKPFRWDFKAYWSVKADTTFAKAEIAVFCCIACKCRCT